MPDEVRMGKIAAFFGVSTEYLRRDNSAQPRLPMAECGPAPVMERTPLIDDRQGPLWVEVERIPSSYQSSFTFSRMWRELTVTMEMKY